ncbi:hypothetical protein [Actinomadura sp.]
MTPPRPPPAPPPGEPPRPRLAVSDLAYLAQQTYLDPYPADLLLRHRI